MDAITLSGFVVTWCLFGFFIVCLRASIKTNKEMLAHQLNRERDKLIREGYAMCKRNEFARTYGGKSSVDGGGLLQSIEEKPHE